MRARSLVLAHAVLLFAWGCSNNPYPDGDSERKVLYSSFSEAPRTLDPAVAYTSGSHAITGNVYTGLLEYHYLARPYRLIPALAMALPEGQPRSGGGVSYAFELRPDLIYQDDPCFEHFLGAPTRPVLAQDFAFQFQRLADPSIDVPVRDPFSNVAGFADFSERLKTLREDDPSLETRPLREQYALAGPIEGVQVRGERGIEIVLQRAYPQILYWFAMPFAAPVPWEAVQHYDGEQGRPRFADHPVGAGAYMLAQYDKQSRMVLVANPNWHGVRHPEWKAPGATFPSSEEGGGPESAGQALPFIERIEFRREKESIPAFNKFLQGYYDAAGIIKESFDKVVVNDRLSPEMEAIGIQLEKSVEPSVYYIGFNMDDAVVGHPAGRQGRLLRQAMSLVIDTREFTRLFTNGRGVPAQSPLPPGIYGYDEGYRNPYRQVDLDRARQLLRDAGYPDGIDPGTREPLALHYDSYAVTADGMLQDQFLVNAWRQLGLDVQLATTNYNQFQKKVREGSYQIFQWGWIADYPDPENFLFLLTSEMARSTSGGPNTANFANARFDALFRAMKSRENDARRLDIIREMIAIVERERPWIEHFHREDYALYHRWYQNVTPFGMSTPMTKYWNIDVALRQSLRRQWNQPVRWPAYALLVVSVALLLPGIVTFYRERQ